MLEQIENKLDAGLDRSINALVSWVKVYLQAEQKKSDFKPDTDVDTVASSACLFVVQTIMPIISHIQKCVDGDNLTAVMNEIGVRLHRAIFENFQQFQYNTAGECFGALFISGFEVFFSTISQVLCAPYAMSTNTRIAFAF